MCVRVPSKSQGQGRQGPEQAGIWPTGKSREIDILIKTFADEENRRLRLSDNVIQEAAHTHTHTHTPKSGDVGESVDRAGWQRGQGDSDASRRIRHLRKKAKDGDARIHTGCVHTQNHLFCGPLISSTAMEAYHMDAYHESADMRGQARMCANGRRCCIRTRLRVLVGDGACRHAHTCGGLWLVTHLHRSRGEPRKPAAPDNRPQTRRLRCMQWLTVSRGSLV